MPQDPGKASLPSSRLPQQARTEPRPPDTPRSPDRTPPAPARMTVTGRVLRPDGQPAAGVPVDIIAAPRTPEAAIDVEPEAFVVLGQGSTDADGRFRIEASRGSSTRFYHVYALAGPAGPGSAFGCVELQTDAEQPAVEIHLPARAGHPRQARRRHRSAGRGGRSRARERLQRLPQARRLAVRRP